MRKQPALMNGPTRRGWRSMRCGCVAVLALGIGLARDGRSADAAPVTQATGITLTITLSRDPVAPPQGYDFCGTSSTVVAYSGEIVRWCYAVRNNTPQTLTLHDLTSSRFGDIFMAFPHALAPGATAFVTRTEPATETRTDVATWVAYNPGPVHINADFGSGRLTVQEDQVMFRDGFE